MSRIGIYAGTFDPIHNGHLAFAEVALTKARLDEVIFLPERTPRHKHGATSYTDRVAMIRQAIKGIQGLRVLKLADERFSINATLPALNRLFPEATCVFLLGSDVSEYLPTWQNFATLLETAELVIATRDGMPEQDIVTQIQQWPSHPRVFTIINNATYQSVSSSVIRESLSTGKPSPDVPSAVKKYIQKLHLYQA